MIKSKSRYFKHPLVITILLIFVVVVISHWQVSFMYYGQDDHSLIFKLQHQSESAGQYGQGLWARNTVYRYIVVPFAPLYKIFGTDPFGYFTISIFNYFLAAVGLYFLIFALTKNRRVSAVTSLIFSAGYVGSDTMLRLTNSYQIPHTILFLCLTMGFYKKYIDNKRLSFYLFSLLLYSFTAEAFFVRTQGIFILLLGLEFLYNLNWKSIFRLTPFAYVYYTLFISGNGSVNELSDFKVKLLTQTFEVIRVSARSIQNLFIPDKFISDKHLLIPVFFCLFLLFVLIKNRNKTMWYGIIFAVGTILVYMLHDPNRDIITTHRYVTIPYVGVAIFLGTFLDKFIKRRSFYLLVSTTVVLLNVTQNNLYFAKNLRDRNAPTRKFYVTLKKEIPFLQKNSLIYFDVAADGESRRLFKENFGVGNMPDTTAIAWQYGIDRYDVSKPDTFMEVLDSLKKGRATKENLYTFYFDASRGLLNTTTTARAALFSNSIELLKIKDPKNINMAFSTPLKVSFKLESQINYQLLQINRVSSDLPTYLSYLQSKTQYYKNVNVSALSEWENERAINLVDNNVDTLWMSDRLEWHDSHSDTIVVDMKKPEMVGALHVRYSSKTRAPTKYGYQCSVDGETWSDLGRFSYVAAENSASIVNEITPAFCRFIKLKIDDSQLGDSPELAEIEVISQEFRDIDILKSEKVQNNPFAFLGSLADLQLLTSYLYKHGLHAQACFYTDKSTNPFCQVFDIFPGANKTYAIIVPPNGTILKSMEILLPKEVNVKVSDMKINTLSFKELDSMKYVPNFKDKL